MKRVHLFLAVGLLLASCGSNSQPPQNNVTYAPQVQQVQQQPQNVQVSAPPVPGFDIQAFNNLLRTTSDPNAIMAAINANGNNINNLDLDGDGNIDYLKVDQINGNTLQVVDEVGKNPNQRTVLATLTINQQNNSYSIQGNQQYCGDTYVYNSQPGISLGQLMFLHWMLMPRTVYYHPTWGYHTGYYGGYHPYHSHYSTPYNSGYMRQRTVTRTTTTTSSSTASNGQRQVQPQRAQTPVQPQRNSLSNPQQSQRQYQVNTNNTGGKVSTGFGSKPATTPSMNSSSSGSRSSFGSSRSSFGSSRSSSSSSGGRRR